jgi:hypothetical protein
MRQQAGAVSGAGRGHVDVPAATGSNQWPFQDQIVGGDKAA